MSEAEKWLEQLANLKAQIDAIKKAATKAGIDLRKESKRVFMRNKRKSVDKPIDNEPNS